MNERDDTCIENLHGKVFKQDGASKCVWMKEMILVSKVFMARCSGRGVASKCMQMKVFSLER